MTARLSGAVAALSVALVLQAAAARADVAADMTAELQAAGVPQLQLTVATPAAASAADASAFQQDPTIDRATLTPLNLLSPDPSAPLPVATVGFGSSSSTALSGLLQPPGIDTYISTQDAQAPTWRLAIMSAMKHAISRGAILAGVAMQYRDSGGGDRSAPDLYVARPDSSDFPPTTLAQTMSTAAAQSSIQAGLPTWAAGAQINVTDSAGGQRQAVATLSIAPLMFETINLQDLVGYLAQKQTDLNASGANIGSVILKVSDVATGAPVATFAGDSSWGQFFAWVSPIGRAYINAPFESADPTEVQPPALP